MGGETKSAGTQGAGRSQALEPDLLAAQPAVYFAFHLILSVAIVLLQASLELLALTIDDVQVIVGKLAPLAFGLAFEFFLVTFDTIPVHRSPPG
jgi:hypothetical protein